MTTKEMIAKLQELDPEGTMSVLILDREDEVCHAGAIVDVLLDGEARRGTVSGRCIRILPGRAA